LLVFAHELSLSGANVALGYSVNVGYTMVQTQISIADLAAGVYTLEFVSASGERISARLIK